MLLPHFTVIAEFVFELLYLCIARGLPARADSAFSARFRFRLAAAALRWAAVEHAAREIARQAASIFTVAQEFLLSNGPLRVQLLPSSKLKNSTIAAAVHRA